MRKILTLTSPDKVGLHASIAGIIAKSGGNILDLCQHSECGQFFIRIEYEGEACNFDTIEGAKWKLVPEDKKTKTIILVSKAGHCLNHLLYRSGIGSLPLDIQAVIGNHTDLKPLVDYHSLPFHHVPNKKEDQLVDIIDKSGAELIILARYMQILSYEMCKRYSRKIINIHHSFLPSFKGAKPYHQAYERGVKIIGATAHYVTADLDEGPIIEQGVVRIKHSDKPQDLVQYGHDVEARVLTSAVKAHIESRIFVMGNKTILF